MKGSHVKKTFLFFKYIRQGRKVYSEENVLCRKIG